MKKGWMLIFLCIILVLPSILAINVKVEKISTDEVWISELDRPVVYDLKVTNLGSSTSISFYNLVGFSMEPSDSFKIGASEVKNINLEIMPIAKLPQSGYYTIPYYIRASDGTEVTANLAFKIVQFENAVEIGSGDVDLASNSIEVFIRNKENFNFGNVDTTFSSPFFNIDKSFTLGPYETKVFSVQLNKEDFRSLLAGFYTMNAQVNAGGKKTNVEGTIKFVEKNLVTTTKKEFGLFVNTNLIEKKNEGNTVEHSETVIKKNIISRLFTSFSPDPDVVERNGAQVYYTWERDVGPGEIFSITVKTNWLFPVLIIIFLVVIVALARRYSQSNLSLSKRVSFVNAKGGEFALKVTINIKANSFIERVNVIDRLPPLVKLYDKFAGDRPARIDNANRRLEWEFEKLSPGETRVMHYIIYSKVGVMGKFALPTATGIFEKNGQIHESESNRAFFVAEPRKKTPEEEYEYKE